MKAQTLIPIFFLLVFFGFQNEANAQASASVSYTIVVTEDMLANGDDGFDRSFEPGNDRSSDRGFASARFHERVQATQQPEMESADFGKDFYTIEMNDLQDAPVSTLHTEKIVQEDGQQHIIFEYN